MASLVQVTRESRIILKIGGVVLGVILIIYFGFKGGAIIRNVFFPKPPPLPKEEFGKLPHISFPSQSNSTINYNINTIDGTLPSSCYPKRCGKNQIQDRVNVYKFIKPEPNLLALKTSKETLDNENFTENQTKITDNIYEWTQYKTGVKIRYDILSQNFTLSSDYLNNTSLASTILMPQPADVKSDVISYLKSINAATDDLDTEKSTVDNLEIQNGNLVAAENLGNAKYAKVTYIQKAVDDIPIIYETPTTSIINFVVSYPNGNVVLLEGQYTHHVVDLNTKSDYPIKSAAEAFEDLKKGNAYVINPQQLTGVDITNVALMYYLDRNTNDFLLPVYVFTGINFTGYVEAVPDAILN